MENLPTLDLPFIRAQFPAFSEPSLDGFAFFENAGGSYACGQVINALQRYYTATKVQPYYGFAPSKTAGELMDSARTRLAAWMNVPVNTTHIGPSTTQNTYVLAQAFARDLKPGDEVVVTNQDHEANIGAWRRLEQAGMVVREWQVNPKTAELETAGLEALLNERTRLVAFTHCSNIVGSINPVREWAGLVRAAGAVSMVDGVSYAPHGIPDVQALGVDAYFYSLYKVYGPHQGVMYLSAELNERLPNQQHFFNVDKPLARFLPAGPDHAQIAAVNGVMDYFDAVHQHHFGSDDGCRQQQVHDLLRSAEISNLEPLLDYLHDKPGVRVIGRREAAARAPTVSILAEGKTPQQIADGLSARGIGIGNGNCYAYRLVRALGLEPEEGVARLSFVHYTAPEEIQRLVEALDEVLG
jgi:cysteine desulfurase family protein (TIGR01976 family)